MQNVELVKERHTKRIVWIVGFFPCSSCSHVAKNRCFSIVLIKITYCEKALLRCVNLCVCVLCCLLKFGKCKKRTCNNCAMPFLPFLSHFLALSISVCLSICQSLCCLSFPVFASMYYIGRMWNQMKRTVDEKRSKATEKNYVI